MDEDEPHLTRRRLPWRALLLFLLLVAAFAGYWRYNTMRGAGGQQVYDNLAVFGSRLENLETSTLLHEKRLQALEQKLAAAAPSAPPPAPASSVSTPSVSATEDERIAALEKEIAALKSVPASTAGGADAYRAIRLLTVYHRLNDKVLAGRPFASELTAYEREIASGAQDESLAELTPYAESGIPTLASLLAAFDAALAQINAADATPPDNLGLWQRFLYRLRHLVSVRKVDESTAVNSVDAILARAQSHLEREEIEAATLEIKTLPARERAAFSGWLQDAKTVLDAPVLMSDAEERVMRLAFRAEPPAAEPKAHP